MLMVKLTCNHSGCLPDGFNSSRTDYHIYQIAQDNTENNPESKDWESTQNSRLATFVSCLSTESPILIGKLQQFENN